MPNLHPTQLILAFVEGVGLILSPCILPILPIMLAASLDGGKKRPLGIITGFIGAFTAFALLSRQLLTWLHADPEIVRNVALALLVVFGLVMLSKKLSDKLIGVTQGLANFGQNLTSKWEHGGGYFSGVAIGALIGLIWTPCAGPIMAAAVVQIIQAKSSLEAALTVIMFAIGAGVPMLAIALAGRKIMSRLTFLKTHSHGVRRVLGLVIIAAAFFIYEGFDVQLLAASGGDTSEKAGAPSSLPTDKLLMAVSEPYPAPPLVGIKDWINSPPLKISDLRGKVVLVDFWTYSCINCVRTLPYITKWDEKYRDQGLVVIGVHSPEFDFEKKPDNVERAVKKYGIHYPVALDSELATWSSFNNKYWPAHYLIDKGGNIVYTHFGEGDYDVTENNIRVLLGVKAAKQEKIAQTETPTTRLQTQETYLGYGRAQNFANEDDMVRDEDGKYVFASPLLLNSWSLAGSWLVGQENITAVKEHASLELNFIAKKVFLVMGSKSGQPVHVHILLNGKPVDKASGSDVKNNMLTVDHEALYELINQGQSKNGILELDSEEPGMQAYAFTFGG